jgi:transcriptional regulator with XRE-family HTH domain
VAAVGRDGVKLDVVVQRDAKLETLTFDADADAEAEAEQEEAGVAASRMLLGARLRDLRESAGISREDAAYAIRASASKISRLEMGRVRCKLRDVGDLLDMYGVRDESGRNQLLDMATQASAPAWWRPFRDAVPGSLETYLSLEPSASLIRTYDVQFIPALLHTPGYAQAVHRMAAGDGDDASGRQRVGLVNRRQQILHRPEPPKVWAVIDEAALRRPVGGATVLRAQLEYLTQAIQMENVSIQVMPLSAGIALAGAPITLLRFPHEGLGDVVCLEQLGAADYLTRPAETLGYWGALNRLATMAEPPAATAGILHDLLAGT